MIFCDPVSTTSPSLVTVPSIIVLPSNTLTLTPFPTDADTATLTPSQTLSETPSDTFTPSDTPPPTSTLIPSVTHTPTLSETEILVTLEAIIGGSATAIFRQAVAQNAEASAVAIGLTQIALSSTPTPSFTLTQTPTLTPLPTLTSTFTPTLLPPSLTPTETVTLVPTPSGGGSGRIIFSSSDDSGSSDLYWANLANGNSLQKIETFDGAINDNPVIVPDGSTIIFQSRSEGVPQQLYTLANQPGAFPQELTSSLSAFTDECRAGDRVPAAQPAVTRDGRRIAFVSGCNGDYDIYVAALVRDGAGRLVIDGKSLNVIPIDDRQGFGIVDELKPTWSADNGLLAFHANVNENTDVYLYNFGTEEITRVTSHPAIDRGAAWSPDGRFIVFSTNRHAEQDNGTFLTNDFQLYIVDVQRLLTNQLIDLESILQRLSQEDRVPVENIRPEWSTDASQIIYHSNRNGRYNIYTLDVYAVARFSSAIGDPLAVNQFGFWEP